MHHRKYKYRFWGKSIAYCRGCGTGASGNCQGQKCNEVENSIEGYRDSFSMMIMKCHLWQSTGYTVSTIWLKWCSGICRVQTLNITPHVCQQHVLFKYDKIVNECKDTTVPHGAFGYIGHNECVHVYQIR